MIKDNNSKWRDGQEFIFPVYFWFSMSRRNWINSTSLSQHMVVTDSVVHRPLSRPLCLATLNSAFKIAFVSHFFLSLGRNHLSVNLLKILPSALAEQKTLFSHTKPDTRR